jgi:branched-chain amino acid transport system ATP-binding protein
LKIVPVLQVEDIDVNFGGVRALVRVSLTADAGVVTGLIGPNGAGKTTLFNVITGLQRPSAGRVKLNGEDITNRRPHQRSRLGVARTFQRLEMFGSLTALDNVRVAAEIHRRHTRNGSDPEVVAREILERVGLGDVADVQADILPTGMARLVELARALATEPKLLLLDEPSAGLDTSESETLGELLTEVASHQIAVLLVEHDMDLVMRVSSRVNVLDFGEMISVGTPEEVQRDPAVRAAYLGADDSRISAPSASQEGVGS